MSCAEDGRLDLEDREVIDATADAAAATLESPLVQARDLGGA
jgi:hypothetical protein